ncbi:F-box domain containing protein, partial [Trema orientale]
MATKRVKTKKDGVPNTTPVDRISTLPDPLIHHILSYVPTIYVVRMSILSRYWRRVWYSVPALHFCSTDHPDRFHFRFHREREEELYEFVIECLKHRERSMRYIADSAITRFKLRIDCYVDNPAIDNLSIFSIWRSVEELDLRMRPKFFENYYCLPEAVLNARSLTVLKLNYVSFDGSHSISLPSLTSLSLMYVKMNDEAVLHNLLLGCPALEKFVFKYYYGLYNPKISSSSLKLLEIENNYETLEVETINLESFEFHSECKDIINLSACKAITSLSLFDSMLDDESLEDLVYGFPLLESLTLYHCFDVKNIKICGQHLKSISLEKYYDPGQEYPEFTIEKPNLVSFHFKGDIQCGISMKELDNILNVHIIIEGPFEGYERDWYINLITFLSKINFSGNTTVSLHVYSEE